MDRWDPRRRRDAFNRVAELYDRFRPGYAPHVAAAAWDAAGVQAGSRVLEIGCGAGQLSIALAERGAALLAVELGPTLAAITRRKLARFADAAVEVAAFEEWPLPREPFDAVFCANSFHWLAQDVRVRKSAQALRPGGTLVIMHPHHVGGERGEFYRDTQRCYVRWGLSDEPDWRPPTAEELSPVYPELEESGEFAGVRRLRVAGTWHFSTENYLGMLSTDSLVVGLDEVTRAGFLDELRELIDSRYGGAVTWNYVYEIVAARTPSMHA